MENFINKTNLKKLFLTSLYFVLGVLFLIFLGKMVDFCESVICFVFIIVGSISIFAFSFMSQDNKIYKLLVFGVIFVLSGIFILFWPKFFVIVLSLYIAYSGIVLILEARKEKLEKNNWIIDFMIGIVILCCAITCIILCNTHVARNIIAAIIGITLLFEVVYNVISMIVNYRKEKEIEENK